jgi:hypothetical protein
MNRITLIGAHTYLVCGPKCYIRPRIDQNITALTDKDDQSLLLIGTDPW